MLGQNGDLNSAAFGHVIEAPARGMSDVEKKAYAASTGAKKDEPEVELDKLVERALPWTPFGTGSMIYPIAGEIIDVISGAIEETASMWRAEHDRLILPTAAIQEFQDTWCSDRYGPGRCGTEFAAGMIDDIKIIKQMMQAFSRLPLQTIDGVELHRLLYIKYPQPAGASLEPARNYSRALMFGANLHQPVEHEFVECQIATHPVQERDHLEVLARPDDFESRPELAVWIAEKMRNWDQPNG